MSKGLVWFLMAAGFAQAAADQTSCHIHPPGSTPEQPLDIVGPFPSLRNCEQQRLVRFGETGRCHCSADFSPRWYRNLYVEPPVAEEAPLL